MLDKVPLIAWVKCRTPGDRNAAQGVHPQMAARAPRCRRQLGGGRRGALHLTRLPPDQWKSVRTTNAIERLHEEFKRRIKPSAETAAMLFWALLASGQISMRKVDGWQTLATKLLDQPFDLAA
jgi:transposase-like protein